jgi:hypothetical protein
VEIHSDGGHWVTRIDAGVSVGWHNRWDRGSHGCGGGGSWLVGWFYNISGYFNFKKSAKFDEFYIFFLNIFEIHKNETYFFLNSFESGKMTEKQILNFTFRKKVC